MLVKKQKFLQNFTVTAVTQPGICTTTGGIGQPTGPAAAFAATPDDRKAGLRTGARSASDCFSPLRSPVNFLSCAALSPGPLPKGVRVKDLGIFLRWGNSSKKHENMAKMANKSNFCSNFPVKWGIFAPFSFCGGFSRTQRCGRSVFLSLGYLT